jgi:RimJ/RimL family protein N-acetyltransferase
VATLRRSRATPLEALHPYVRAGVEEGLARFRALPLQPVDAMVGRGLEADGRVLAAYGEDQTRLGWPAFQFDRLGRPWPLVAQTVEWTLDRLTRGLPELAEGLSVHHPELDALRAFWALPCPRLGRRPPHAVILEDPQAVITALTAFDPLVATVHLREVRADDLPIHFAQQRDPESNALAGVPARDREAFDAHWAELLADPGVVLRTVVADGEVAGSALSFVRDGRRQVGYWIGREHWGRGIASRALALLLDELAERPLYATVAAHNAASLRILSTHGFERVDRRDDVVVLRLA